MMKQHVIRAAIRLSLGCMIPLLIDQYVLKGGDLDELKSCQWASVTVVMTSEPLLGQFVKKGLERMAGSFVGGLIAMAVASVWINQWFFIATSAVVLYLSLDVLTKLGYDYTGKLLAITFLLVLWGTETNSKVLWVASTRLLGVIGGVLLGMLLNMVVSPHTATTECIWATASALEALQSISSCTWETGKAGIDQLDDLCKKIDEQCNACSASIDKMTAHLKISKVVSFLHIKKRSTHSHISSYLRSIHTSESLCAMFLRSTCQREYLIGRFRSPLDRDYFYPIYASFVAKPLIFWRTWQIPAYEMEKVGQEVKRVFNILWSLHLTFTDGFDSATMQRITNHYPPGLFSKLSEYANEAVNQVVAVFPKVSSAQTVKSRVPRDALERFSSCMRQFAVLSEFQGIRAANIYRHKVRKEAMIRKAAEIATASLDPTSANEVMDRASQETEQLRTSAPPAHLHAAGTAAPLATDNTRMKTPFAAVSSTAAAESSLLLPNSPPYTAGTTRSPVSRQGSANSGPKLLSLASFVDRRNDEGCSKAMEALLEEGWSPSAAEGLSTESLPDSKTHDLEDGIFPLNEEGWTLKLCWHNLLFILEELDTDLEDLYDAMDDLLKAMRYREEEPDGSPAGSTQTE